MRIPLPATFALTRREREVLYVLAHEACQVCGGQTPTNAAMAAALGIAPHTVSVHLHHLYQKLGLPDRQALASLAYARDGLAS